MSTALITGASSGIGFELATQLAERGYSLLLVARREDRLRTLADALQEKHGVVVGILPCDLSERASLNALMARVDAWLADHHETLTLLANNAGAGVWIEFKDQIGRASGRGRV